MVTAFLKFTSTWIRRCVTLRLCAFFRKWWRITMFHVLILYVHIFYTVCALHTQWYILYCLFKKLFIDVVTFLNHFIQCYGKINKWMLTQIDYWEFDDCSIDWLMMFLLLEKSYIKKTVVKIIQRSLLQNLRLLGFIGFYSKEQSRFFFIIASARIFFVFKHKNFSDM